MKQRVLALNLFLKDIYSKKQIVKDGVVPEDFIFASSGYTVILTPGRFNATYFEHSYLAECTGAHLANGSELTVKDDKLYFITADGKYERVGAVYRRISDEYLDPMNFKEIMDYKYGIQFTSFYMPGEFMPHVRMMDEGYSTLVQRL